MSSKDKTETHAATDWFGIGDETTLGSLPDVQILCHVNGQTYYPVRGAAYVLGVMVGGQTVGWIPCRDLGFKTAVEWMAKAQEEESKG